MKQKTLIEIPPYYIDALAFHASVWLFLLKPPSYTQFPLTWIIAGKRKLWFLPLLVRSTFHKRCDFGQLFNKLSEFLVLVYSSRSWYRVKIWRHKLCYSGPCYSGPCHLLHIKKFELIWKVETIIFALIGPMSPTNLSFEQVRSLSSKNHLSCQFNGHFFAAQKMLCYH
jgi:hypothetical protein